MIFLNRSEKEININASIKLKMGNADVDAKGADENGGERCDTCMSINGMSMLD